MSETSREAQDTGLPRTALVGAAVLVAVSLLAVALVRATGVGATRMPAAAVVELRDLRFADRADGAVVVLDASGAHEVAVLAPGTHGFVRGVLRGLARDRKLAGVGQEPPFRLIRWSDGRLSLEDPSTGRHVDLEAFGETNSGAFAQLLHDGAEPRIAETR